MPPARVLLYAASVGLLMLTGRAVIMGPPSVAAAVTVLFLYIGLILVFLPWTRVWALNRFFLYYAHVSRLMESGAVRGLVSGLGLLNLWVAISEAIHYKES